MMSIEPLISMPFYEMEKMGGWEPRHTGEFYSLSSGVYERVVFKKQEYCCRRILSCVALPFYYLGASRLSLNQVGDSALLGIVKKEGLVCDEKKTDEFFWQEFVKIGLINEKTKTRDFERFEIVHHPSGHAYIPLILPTLHSSVIIFGYKGQFGKDGKFISFRCSKDRSSVELEKLLELANAYCESVINPTRRPCF